MSGDVHIIKDGEETRIPGSALIEFVAEFVRDERMADLDVPWWLGIAPFSGCKEKMKLHN